MTQRSQKLFEQIVELKKFVRVEKTKDNLFFANKKKAEAFGKSIKFDLFPLLFSNLDEEFRNLARKRSCRS